MRNPKRWRDISLAVFASGMMAAPVAFLLPDAVAGDNARGVLFCYGLMALIFGGWFAMFCHRDLHAKEALSRGEDILGRWRIGAEAWREFKALNDNIHRRPDVLFNEFQLRDEIPADGIEIIVRKTAIKIDGSIHRFPTRGVPEVTHSELHDGNGGPSYIELLLYYPGSGAGTSGVAQTSTRTALRFPVPGSSWREAKTIVAHYGGLLGGTPDFFHGSGDGSDSEDLSKCWSCGYETHRYKSQCPQCGAGLQSRRWSRRAGFMLVLCGLFMTGLMGTVCYYTVPMLLQPGVDIDGGGSFSGNAYQALMVLGIFSAVMAFSLTTLFYGLWQVVTGKRDKRIAYFMIGVFNLLMLVALVIGKFGL